MNNELDIQRVYDTLKSSRWYEIDELTRMFRDYIPAAMAVRRFHQWYRGANQTPLDIQIALGSQYWIMTKMNQWKRKGYLETRGDGGAKRQYRIYPKGFARRQ